ncbi:MAG TPA: bifunctional riboflavin kinase/FAD synthetase [Devosiaceae bacterium]
MSRFLRLNGLSAIPPELRGGIVAIGNFDGCHLGHQAVFTCALEKARELGVPALVLTFEPHPRDVFAPEPFMFRLTGADAKARIAEGVGMDGVVIAPFDREFATIEAEDFVDRFLVEALGARGVVVGADFHFGKARRGTPEFLRAAGQARGFEVTQIGLLEDGYEPVSSSRVRAALAAAELETANRLLGYHWFVEGEVVVGDRRGRELGFPTANIAMPESFQLAQGVYAVRARVGDDLFDGVASFGKPMFDAGPPPFETHLFDTDRDLYGAHMAVALLGFVRGQMKFDGLDALISAMHDDSARARQMISEARALSALDIHLGFFAQGDKGSGRAG